MPTVPTPAISETVARYKQSVIKAADLAVRLNKCGEIASITIAAIKAASAYCVQREDVLSELGKRGSVGRAMKRSRSKRNLLAAQEAYWNK